MGAPAAEVGALTRRVRDDAAGPAEEAERRQRPQHIVCGLGGRLIGRHIDDGDVIIDPVVGCPEPSLPQVDPGQTCW
jgi:hypothetical protein